MSRHEWFRNDHWNAEIELAFYSKLKRSRKKAQYIRIQACYLCRSYPQIALQLLDEYFALDDHFDDASAFGTKAECYLALGDVNCAIHAYEQAVAQEEQFRGPRTQSRIELPYLIATHQVRSKYGRALQLLEASDTMLFPLQRFKYHTAYALISADLSKVEAARRHANDALREAQCEHSGLRYHANLGLVDTSYDNVRVRLEQIAGNHSQSLVT